MANKQKYSICMLMPYFGELPKWFPLYLETCGPNSTIDWLFFTNCSPGTAYPENVKFVSLSLKDLEYCAAARLNLEVTVPTAFKICDFRPAFGLIFEDYLSSYDFWGWGDVDVFYGNLRAFLTEDLLKSNDLISPREGFLAGEFTLLRNSPKINHLFMESADYEKVFTSGARCWDFEEYGFFKDRQVDSMTHVANRLAARGEIQLHFQNMLKTDRKIKDKPFKFYWHEGRLFDLATGEEILLYHFLDRKKIGNFCLPEDGLNSSGGFFITNTGVVPCRSPFEPRRKPMVIFARQIRNTIGKLVR